MIRVFWCIIGCLVLGLGVAQQGETDEAQINAQLEQIKARLDTLKSALNQAQGEEAGLISELEKQDQAINLQAQAIRSTQAKIDTSQLQIDTLGAQIKAKNESISEQKQQMADLLRLHVFINHDRIIKMLLLNPNSQAAEVTQHQVKYLQHKLYQLIENIAVQITQLQQYQAQINTQNEALKRQKEQLESEQATLLAQKNQRTQVLNQLRVTIRAYQDENQTLTQDRNRLNQLLSELTQLLDDLPEGLGENVSFAQLKGQLTRPVKGKVIRSYRSLRAGYSRWDGIVLGQPAGQDVAASAYGRVAFADWLRGYGLLIVIDHGDEYMTLYGHNESILAEVGDWVQAGQVIATAGNSGNIDPSGVYFEIRKAADPTNPVPWLKR